MTAALLGLILVQRVSAQTDCEAARCAVQQALNESCPCDDARFTNHGRYVSCVARTVNKLSKDGVIPTNCKGKVKRCAARSTCGKAGAVACTINEPGTCDVTAGTCTVGTLASGLTVCATDADCIASSRCSVKRSTERCDAAGGISGSGTCCASCGG
jgi:hypothetical protein